jgi:hypothetical protein
MGCLHDGSEPRVRLHLIREESSLLEASETLSPPEPRRIRRILWILIGVAVMLLGGSVLSALCTARHHVLGVVATVIIWLQALSCFVRAYRSTR